MLTGGSEMKPQKIHKSRVNILSLASEIPVSIVASHTCTFENFTHLSTALPELKARLLLQIF